MILKLKDYPNSGCYGRVGDKVVIDNINFFVGDVYDVKILTGDNSIKIVSAVIVNRKKDKKGVGYLMGVGELRRGEHIEEKIQSHTRLKVGDVLNDSLIVCKDE